MEFYYWEPQHLDKKKNIDNRYTNSDKALRHIQKREVSLNHMFNVFFRLAPSPLINFMHNAYYNEKINDNFTLQNRYSISQFSALIQPDLLFNSNTINFSIEMKIEAKSSLEQVYKYALLHWLEQKHSAISKQSYLFFIGKNDFSSLWKEKFPDIRTLKENLQDFDNEALKVKVKRKEKIEVNWEEVDTIANETKIAYCNYTNFSHLLKNYLSKVTSGCTADETLHKLVLGLSDELERRGLVK